MHPTQYLVFDEGVKESSLLFLFYFFVCLFFLFHSKNIFEGLFQLVFTYSKSTMKTPEQCVKSVYVNKDARTTSYLTLIRLYKDIFFWGINLW